MLKYIPNRAPANPSAVLKDKEEPISSPPVPVPAVVLGNNTSDLGNPIPPRVIPSATTEKGKEIKSLDDVRERLREKNAFDNMSVNFGYVFKTLETILLKTKFFGNGPNGSGSKVAAAGPSSEANLMPSPEKPAPAVKPPGGVAPIFDSSKLEHEERALLYSKATWLRLCADFCNNKMSRNCVARILAYLSFCNETMTRDVFDIIEKELMDRDNAQLKVYLIILNKLCAIKDDQVEYKISRAPSIIMNAFKANVPYLRASEIIYEYLLKICTQDREIRAIFAKQTDFFKQVVESWLADYQAAYSSVQTGKFKILKKGTAPVTLQYLSQQVSKFQQSAQDKLIRTKKILRGEDDSLVFDSDEEYNIKNLKKDDRFDYYYEGAGWYPAYLVDNLDEMMLIQLKYTTGPANKWVYYDADALAPADKAQAHYKNHVEYYKP